MNTGQFQHKGGHAMGGPVKVIRAKYLDCAGSKKEVRLCQTQDCPLYSYRMGKNPNRAGIGGGQGNFSRHSSKDF